eukprot:scaffold323217_cov15-Tisochrysis_lutea.AAC.1
MLEKVPHILQCTQRFCSKKCCSCFCPPFHRVCSPTSHALPADTTTYDAQRSYRMQLQRQKRPPVETTDCQPMKPTKHHESPLSDWSRLFSPPKSALVISCACTQNLSSATLDALITLVNVGNKGC